MGRLLSDSEIAWFDQTNVEVLELAGAEDVILWKFAKIPASLDPTKPHPQDCLYNEPGEASELVVGKRKGNYTPYRCIGFFEKPAIEDTGGDYGLEVLYDARVY